MMIYQPNWLQFSSLSLVYGSHEQVAILGAVSHFLTKLYSLITLLKRSHEYAWIGERSRDFADHTPGQDLKWSSLLPSKPLFISGEIMTKRECWKSFFFKFKSFLEWGSWWSLLPLGPNWHLQLLQLLFRYIEAGGIPSILFHYIALLFSTTICWYPLPFWLPFYFMCARGASSRSG